MINDHNQLQQKVNQMGQVSQVFQKTLADNIGQRSAIFWIGFVDGQVGGLAFGNHYWETMTVAELTEVKQRLSEMISKMEEKLDNSDQILSDLYNLPSTS